MNDAERWKEFLKFWELYKTDNDPDFIESLIVKEINEKIEEIKNILF